MGLATSRDRLTCLCISQTTRRHTPEDR